MHHYLAIKYFYIILRIILYAFPLTIELAI